MIRYISLLVMLAIALAEAKCQDVSYSQPLDFGLIVSPALIGNFDGNLRASAVFRNQHLLITNSAMPGVYNSYGVSADLKLMSDRTEPNTWAIGMYMSGDHAGQGSIATHDLQLGSSYRLALDGYGHTFMSIGATGGVTARRLFSADLLFENQVRGFEFDPNTPNFESLEVDRARFQFNYSIGAMVQHQFSESVIVQSSLGIYNLNSPKDFFVEKSTSATYKRIHMMAGMLYKADYTLMIMPSIIWSQQGTANMTNIGLRLEKELSETVSLLGGFRYRWDDALIPNIGLKYSNYYLSASFDFTTSRLNTANQSLGAFELHFTYIHGSRAIYENSSKMKCPSF